jgi:hypothetical protein
MPRIEQMFDINMSQVCMREEITWSHHVDIHQPKDDKQA